MDIPPVEDPLLHFLASCIQRHGNRKRATRTVARTLLWLHTFTRGPPLEMLREGILMAAPAVRCTHQVLGGHKVVPKPIALSEKQRTRQAIQWILKASDNRSGQTLEERLAREIVSILQGDVEKNAVLLKKKQAHEYAMVNRGSAEARV
ncbi:ribosomal protein S7 domain-containing protein [Amylostereum chailletii]|nr:ribosomal protein S7 domain-containing protein [Amylostereum chailletii]